MGKRGQPAEKRPRDGKREKKQGDLTAAGKGPSRRSSAIDQCPMEHVPPPCMTPGPTRAIEALFAKGQRLALLKLLVMARLYIS